MAWDSSICYRPKLKVVWSKEIFVLEYGFGLKLKQMLYFRGCLIDYFGPSGPSDLGVPLSALVADTISGVTGIFLLLVQRNS